MTCYVGIDIGLNGGIAAIIDGSPAPAMFEMPTSDVETKKKKKNGDPMIKRVLNSSRVLTIFTELRKQFGDVFVMIERPQMRPAFTSSGDLCPVCKQPRFEKGQGIVSQAKFLGQYERIAGILEGLGIAFEDVHPSTWKADVFRGASDKTDARMKASQLYPAVASKLTLKKNDGIAESLLLADYGRRRRESLF